MFNEFQQPLSKVDIANDGDENRHKASGVASNTLLLSEVFPGGVVRRHSCRHERGVTYHRTSATSACHCAPALFYIRGGRCPGDKATAVCLSVPDWGVSCQLFRLKYLGWFCRQVTHPVWLVSSCLSASFSSSFSSFLHFRINRFLFIFAFVSTFHSPFPRLSISSLFKKTPWPQSASEIYRTSDRRLSAQLFADRGCHVVSVTNPYVRILAFLDRSGYYFFQVGPQLYSRGWVVPVISLFRILISLVFLISHILLFIFFLFKFLSFFLSVLFFSTTFLHFFFPILIYFYIFLYVSFFLHFCCLFFFFFFFFSNFLSSSLQLILNSFDCFSSFYCGFHILACFTSFSFHYGT
jgi:hypothetical protein